MFKKSFLFLVLLIPLSLHPLFERLLAKRTVHKVVHYACFTGTAVFGSLGVLLCTNSFKEDVKKHLIDKIKANKKNMKRQKIDDEVQSIMKRAPIECFSLSLCFLGLGVWNYKFR